MRTPGYYQVGENRITYYDEFMQKIINTVHSFAWLLLLVLLANGCKGGSKEKVYVIARDKSWYPLNLLGKEKNMLGFTDDLLYTIAHMENFDIDLESSTHDSMLSQLQNGVFDAIITFETPTEKLKRTYNFSDSFFNLGPVLVVPYDSNVKTINDMKGKVVGIQTRASVIYNIDEIPDIIFTPFENILFALRSLAEGHIDGVILESLPAHEYIESFYKGELKIVPPPLTLHGLRLMTLKNPTEQNLIENFNDGLKKMKEDNTYHDFLEKWGLFDPHIYTGTLPEKDEEAAQ